MSSPSPDRPTEPDRATPAERRRRLRGRNLALLAVLMAWVALIYVAAILRMGGGGG